MLKILIAVDGSELSLDGVHHVLNLVRQGLQATVVLGHVQEPATLYELVTARDPELIADHASTWRSMSATIRGSTERSTVRNAASVSRSS